MAKQTKFTRLVIVKNYGTNAAVVGEALEFSNVVYEKELVDCITLTKGVVDYLYVMYRFKCTDQEFTGVMEEIHKCEDFEDWLVIAAGSVAGEIVRIQRK